MSQQYEIQYDEFGYPIVQEQDSIENSFEEQQESFGYQEEEEQQVYEDLIPYGQGILKIKKQASYFINREIQFNQQKAQEIFQKQKNKKLILIAGSFKSGKTKFMNMLSQIDNDLVYLNKTQNNKNQSFKKYYWQEENNLKCNLFLEQRCLFYLTPEQQEVCLQILCLPGHSDFIQDNINYLNFADKMILIIDCVYGLKQCDYEWIKNALKNKLEIIYVLNKIDSLYLDLQLSQNDAFLLLEQKVNQLLEIENFWYDKLYFSSSKYNILISCQSIIKENNLFKDIDINQECLFGEIFYDQEKDKFENIKSKNNIRLFNYLFLDQMYQILSIIITSEKHDIKKQLKQFNIKPKGELKKESDQQIIKQCFKQKFFHSQYLINQLQENNFLDQANQKLDESNQDLQFVCFWAFPDFNLEEEFVQQLLYQVKILKGNMQVKGEFINNQNELVQIKKIFIQRFQDKLVSIDEATENDVVLICTNYDLKPNQIYYQNQQPIKLTTQYLIGTFQLNIRPINFNDSDLLENLLQKTVQIFPSVSYQISLIEGFMIQGTGEFSINSFIYFLTHLFNEIHIQVSQPQVLFRESVEQQSQKFAYSEQINRFVLKILLEPKENSNCFTVYQNEFYQIDNEIFDWDLLQIFNKQILFQITPLLDIVFQQGFLISEQTQNITIKIVDFSINDSIPFNSKQCLIYLKDLLQKQFLLSKPCILEPLYSFEIHTKQKYKNLVKKIIENKRVQLQQELYLYQTPFIQLKGFIYALDIFGLETELRNKTKDNVEISFIFNKFDWIQGDIFAEEEIQDIENIPNHLIAKEVYLKIKNQKQIN